MIHKKIGQVYIYVVLEFNKKNFNKLNFTFIKAYCETKQKFVKHSEKTTKKNIN